MNCLSRFLAIFGLILATSLVGCAAPSNQTGEDLAAIVKAERGNPTPAANSGCQVPSNLIGKPHTDLNTMKFKVPIRVIFPGTAVTGDHVANRLNFKVDKKGIIKSITCG